MDNMSRDKVKHYYLLTAAFLMSGIALSSLNIWNATWDPHKEDKLMQYQIGKKGP
jgi:hypothetical protein